MKARSGYRESRLFSNVVISSSYVFNHLQAIPFLPPFPPRAQEVSTGIHTPQKISMSGAIQEPRTGVSQ